MRYRAVTVTIASGQTLSNVIDMQDFGPGLYARNLFILSPATLPETVTVQVALDGITYVALQSGGEDITLPAGKGTQINKFQVRYFRLSAGGAVAAIRTFEATVSLY